MERSIEEQIEDCKRYAAAHGLEVVHEFNEGSGVSAHNPKTKRPKFDEACEWVASTPGATLLVRDLDRLSRRGMGQVGLLLDRMEQVGSRLVDITTGTDTSDDSQRMVIAIRAEMAREESARISRRVRRAKGVDAKAGKPNGGGYRPFGFDVHGMSHHTREAALIRSAVARFRKGESLSAIADDWATKGIKTTAGSAFTVRKLSALLRRPRLAGYRQVTNDDGTVELVRAQWEPIISGDDWAWLCERFGMVQDGATLHAPRNRRKVSGGVRLLTGLVHCHCGAPMRYSGNRDDAYVCEQGHGGIKADTADRVVLYDARMHARFTGALGGTEVDRAALEDERAGLAERRRQLVRSLTRGLIEEADYEEGLQEIAARLEAVEAGLRRDELDVMGGPVEDWLEEMGRQWDWSADQALSEGLRRFVVAMVEDVEVAPYKETLVQIIAEEYGGSEAAWRNDRGFDKRARVNEARLTVHPREEAGTLVYE